MKIKTFCGVALFAASLSLLNLWSKPVEALSGRVSQPVRMTPRQSLRLVVADLLERALSQAGQRWPSRDFEAAVDGVTEVSERYNLPPTLVLSLIQTESSFHLRATSSQGAVGLTQVMPSTAEIMAKRLDLPQPDPDQLFDPATNILLGFAYLDLLHQQYGSMDAALVAYNGGPGVLRYARNGSLPLTSYRREIKASEGRISQWLKKP